MGTTLSDDVARAVSLSTTGLSAEQAVKAQVEAEKLCQGLLDAFRRGSLELLEVEIGDKDEDRL